MDIRGSHLSSDGRHKIRLLAAFKRAVSAWAPEFQDLHQKVSKLVLHVVVSPLPDSFPSVYKLLYTIVIVMIVCICRMLTSSSPPCWSR